MIFELVFCSGENECKRRNFRQVCSFFRECIIKKSVNIVETQFNQPILSFAFPLKNNSK